MTSTRPSSTRSYKCASWKKHYRNTDSTLTGTHIVGPWRFQGRGRYYDEFFEAHGGVATFPFISDAKFFLDAEAAYTFNDSLTLAAGVHNLLDEYPSENPFQQVYGAKYAESSPYGFNGGFYYLRASLDF